MNIRVIRSKSKEFNRGSRSLKKSNKNIVILFLFFVFLVGIIIGSSYFKFKIDSNYFEEQLNFFERNNIENLSIDREEVFRDALLKNILTLVIFWIVGLSIIGAPILVFYILYEGFSVSITIMYILSILGIGEGYRYAYSTIFATTLINVLAVVFLCNSAIRVTLNVLKQKSDIKTEFIRHSAVCLIMLVLFIISSLNEAFIIEFCKGFILNL